MPNHKTNKIICDDIGKHFSGTQIVWGYIPTMLAVHIPYLLGTRKLISDSDNKGLNIV